MAIVICPLPLQADEYVHEEIVELSRSIQQDPANPRLYLLRGDQYRNQQNWGKALADLRKARRLGADGAVVETGLGRICAEQGLHQQAIAHLNNALARQPGRVLALIARAESNRVLKKPLAAASDYSRAINQFRSPRRPLPEYYLQRARAYAEAGDQYIDSALRGLDEGIQVLGNIRILELYAVELEHKRDNVEAALQRLDSIIAGANRRESLLVRRGDILLSVNRIEEARQDYLAAQAAIEDLPPPRRHTRSIMGLRNDIDARLKTTETLSGHGH